MNKVSQKSKPVKKSVEKQVKEVPKTKPRTKSSDSMGAKVVKKESKNLKLTKCH